MDFGLCFVHGGEHLGGLGIAVPLHQIVEHMVRSVTQEVGIWAIQNGGQERVHGIAANPGQCLGCQPANVGVAIFQRFDQRAGGDGVGDFAEYLGDFPANLAAMIAQGANDARHGDRAQSARVDGGQRSGSPRREKRGDR